MDRLYDVIIIGAGPAGSIAGLCLARSGCNVLMIDSASFPRDKICGDELAPVGLQLLKELGIYDQIISSKAYPIRKAQLYGPFGTELSFSFEFKSEAPEIMIVPRKVLDNQLVQSAESAGAHLLLGRVTGIKQKKHDTEVIVREGDKYHKCRARAVIGADGATSVLARQLNVVPWRHRVLAVRGYLSDFKLCPNTMEGYFNHKWWPGYAWIFPLSSDSANVGLGIDIRHFRQNKDNLGQLLEQLLYGSHFKSRISKNTQLSQLRTWPLNLGPPVWENLVRDRCILVGDAAGLINPLTGGGLANAMLSGKIAAEVLTEELNQNKSETLQLKKYVNKIRELLNKELWISWGVSRTLAMSPHLLEFLFKRMNHSNLMYSFINRFQDVRISPL